MQNKTNIDSKSVKLSILVNQNEYNTSMLAFDFECLKFEKNLLEIQLKFKNPNYISYLGSD